MAEADDHDHQDVVLDSVDDSIVADANTIEIVETGQTLMAGRSRVRRASVVSCASERLLTGKVRAGH